MASNGLVLVGNQAPSAASSVSFDNVFTATYRNYLVVTDLDGGPIEGLNFRLRVSGSSDSTATHYWYQYSSMEHTTNVRGRVQAGQWQVAAVINTGPNRCTANIFSPQLASPTRFESRQYDDRVVQGLYAGVHTQSTSYDGLEVFVGSNITGNISIYGYTLS